MRRAIYPGIIRASLTAIDPSAFTGQAIQRFEYVAALRAFHLFVRAMPLVRRMALPRTELLCVLGHRDPRSSAMFAFPGLSVFFRATAMHRLATTEDGTRYLFGRGIKQNIADGAFTHHAAFPR